MVLRLRQHNIGYTADGFYRKCSHQDCESCSKCSENEKDWRFNSTELNWTVTDRQTRVKSQSWLHVVRRAVRYSLAETWPSYR